MKGTVMKRIVIFGLAFSLCMFGHLFGRLFHRHCYACGNVAVVAPTFVTTQGVPVCQNSIAVAAPVVVQSLAIPSVAVLATPVVATPVVEEKVIVKERRVNVRARNTRVRVFVR